MTNGVGFPPPQVRCGATRLLLPEEGGIFRDGGGDEAGRRPGGVTGFLVRVLAPPCGTAALAGGRHQNIVGLRTSLVCFFFPLKLPLFEANCRLKPSKGARLRLREEPQTPEGLVFFFCERLIHHADGNNVILYLLRAAAASRLSSTIGLF